MTFDEILLNFDEFCKKGNFLLVIITLYFLIAIPLVGIRTIYTLLFEVKSGTSKIEYRVCIEQEYDDRGSYCVEEENRFTTLDKRIKSHHSQAIFYWYISVIIIFFYNYWPKLILFKDESWTGSKFDIWPKIKQFVNAKKLSLDDLKLVDIDIDEKWIGGNYSYKFHIVNNSQKSLKKIKLLVQAGLYWQLDFQSEEKYIKKYPIILNVNIQPGMEFERSILLQEEDVRLKLTKKQSEEGWRTGLHKIDLIYIESF